MEAAKAIAKHLKKVLTEAETNLAMMRYDLATTRADMVMARANLALEKKKREAEAMIAREKLVEAKREKVTVERYKASLDFTTKMTCTIAALRASKEFSDACVTFDHETFEKAISRRGLNIGTKSLTTTKDWTSHSWMKESLKGNLSIMMGLPFYLS